MKRSLGDGHKLSALVMNNQTGFVLRRGKIFLLGPPMLAVEGESSAKAFETEIKLIWMHNCASSLSVKSSSEMLTT